MTGFAQKLGIDPVEFRRRNAIREGRTTLAYGAEMNPNGLREAIDRVAAEIAGQEGSLARSAQGHRQRFRLFLKAPAMPPNAASARS